MKIRFKRAVIRCVMYPVFHLWLKHLIKRNYRMRAVSAICREYKIPPCTPDGKSYEDKWYWADYISSKYGYNVEHSVSRDKWIWKQLHAGI